MTLDLSDIEDIGVPHQEKNVDQFHDYREAGPGVRIRKLKKTVKPDCSEGTCGNCNDNNVSCTDNAKVTAKKRENSNDGLSNDINPEMYTIYLKTWGCSHNTSDMEYMAGILNTHGFNTTTTDYTNSQVVILNSCTVKGPSEQHFKNEIDRAVSSSKHVILAGCVPQSDKSYRSVASVIGVNQLTRVVEVVEETLKGNKVTYVSSKTRGRPATDLNLPKIRKNELVEIIPISTGCLNNCTYCKTKQARGQLVSYPIDMITSRIKHTCENEGVKEIWFTSEDLGCWGLDLGLTIVDLLNTVVEILPKGVMLRLGMTNPPYILDHLEEISRILTHPNVYKFLHIPVQSGSTPVLAEMKREYTRKDFERICDFMLSRVPNITLATDVICGYPTETEEDFNETYSLVEKYKFPVLFINQFYPRPGTQAAKLKRIATDVVKARTRKLNNLFQGYSGISSSAVGGVQRVLVTDIAHDGVKYVGHNSSYQQVLIDKTLVVGNAEIMGKYVDVVIADVTKFAMIGGKAYVVTENKFNFVYLLLCLLLILIMYGIK